MFLGKPPANDLDPVKNDKDRLYGEGVASERFPGQVPCNPAALYALLHMGNIACAGYETVCGAELEWTSPGKRRALSGYTLQ